MHEDNQFGRCGRTLLWISDHILHGTLLSLPSPSSVIEEGEEGTRRRYQQQQFYYGQLMMFISIYYAPLHLALAEYVTIFTKKLKETQKRKKGGRNRCRIETTPKRRD
uniref:Uncharacterized protein n=1 Tax=Salix viminalis TaxID=40686 RepID=A0A6N2L878_SALVM